MSLAQRLATAAPSIRRAAIVTLLALATVAAWAAVVVGATDRVLASWWPAAGPSVLAGMLARDRERWPVILLVALATAAGNVMAGRDPALAVVLGVGNSIEVMIAAALLAPHGVPPTLTSLSASARFIGVALLSAVGSGLVLGSSAALFLGQPWLASVSQLSASHASATLVLVPVALVPLRSDRRVGTLEGVSQAVVLTALVAFVFWPGNHWPIAFVPLVAMLWAALRFPSLISAIQLFLTSAGVIALTALGGGPFASTPGAPQAVVFIQLFVLVYAVAAILVAGSRSDWFVLVQRLETQEAALRQGIGSADVGIAILEKRDGRLHPIAMNPIARAALGRELPPYGIPPLDLLLARGAGGGASFDREGSLFEATVSVSGDSVESQRFSVVVVDVTEREARERQVIEYAEQLRLLNVNKDDFVSSVSHELRTPVTSILGFSEILDDERIPPDLAEARTIIARNARRLADVIDDVLELSRLSALGGPLPEVTEVDLVQLARACAADASGLALARRVRVELSPDVPPSLVVLSRERDLVRVCTNLLSNAVKFSADNAVVTIGVASHEGGAMLRVVDHGLGIPEEYRDVVWQRFSRAPLDDHRDVPGTGLGLAIVKALLESRLGGSARLLGTPGGGTTVEVILPAEAPTDSSPHPVE